jgi:hypothetical protein
MRQTRLRRLWPLAVLPLVILVLIVAYLRSPGDPSPVVRYDVVDAQTLTIMTWGNRRDWCRATGVVETQAEVRIAIGCLGVWMFLPGPADLSLTPVTVTLSSPLGERKVLNADGSPPGYQYFGS